MVKAYNAPKPRYSNWVWFKFIALRTVFPPILLWDLIKFVGNKLFGELVGGLVLPAQNENYDSFKVTDHKVSDYNEDNQTLTCEKYNVITYDEAQLDTFEVKHAVQKNTAPEHQKYIINLVGNGMCYEHITVDMLEDAEALQANVVGFNHRGVGQSTGKAKSSNDLVIDCIAQVQRLLDKGVSPQNITLKGHSLGAGVASLAAQHFHQLGQPINIFNSRSFSTITNFVVGHIRLERDAFGLPIGHKDSRKGIILSLLAKPFIKIGVALVKWEINAGSAFKSIPEEYRDYIVVRSRKAKRGKRLDDAVIPHYASIHKELTSERRSKKSAIDREIRKIDNISQKANSHAKSELTIKRDHLVKTREKIKSDRKMETKSPSEEGHNAGWLSISNRSGTNALTFFREFVQRAEKEHGVTNALEIS